MDVQVDGAETFQVMHGFGTCVKTWGSADEDPVIKWTFSTEYTDLYVKEARMAMARIPISKWVLEGDNPYKIPARVTQAMIDDPTIISYKDFSWENTGRAKASPVYALNWAKQLTRANPALKVIGSVWSPPHWMKQAHPTLAQGKKFHWSKFGSSSCGGRLNPKFYTHYGHYLAEWVKGLKEVHGIDLYAISIQNELHFYEPYDSCVYTPTEFAATVKAVGDVFKEEGIICIIMGPEDMTKFPERSMRHVIEAMKDKDTAEYLQVINSHGYADGIVGSLDAGDAATFWSLMQKHSPDREYWMTETGAGEANWEPIERVVEKGKKKGEKEVVAGALSGFAGMLHNAIVHGNASVWTHWQFLNNTPECNHALVHATMEQLRPTKKYYVMKHYSRYIPVGAQRVAAVQEAVKEITASAYVHKEQAALTVILTNHSYEAQSVNIVLKNVPALTALRAFVTDKDRDAAPDADVGVNAGVCTVVLPPRSLMTLSTLD